MTQKKRRNNLATRITAFMLSGAMLFTSSGMQVLAEETANAEPAVVAEAPAPAPAPETQAPETKAPETQAPETQAPETQAPETQAPETKAPETNETENPAPSITEPETNETENPAPGITEPETNETENPAPEVNEPETQAPETEIESESESEFESESESESESEIETELADLQASVKEVITENEDGQLSMSFEMEVKNRADKGDAEDIDVKVILMDEMTYDANAYHTEQLQWIEDIAQIPQGLDLDEFIEHKAQFQGTYASALYWNDQDIDAKTEKKYQASVKLSEEVDTVEEVHILYYVDGELVPQQKIELQGAELLEREEVNTQSEFVFTDGNMIVTATLSDPEILPAGVEFVVKQIEPTAEDLELAAGTVDEEVVLTGYIAYDMHFEKEGEEVEPEGGEVSISVSYQNPIELTQIDSYTAKVVEKNVEAEDMVYSVVHISEEGTSKSADLVAEDMDVTAAGKVEGAEFAVENFSTLLLLAGAANPPIPDSDDKFPYNYTLSSFLNGYNVLAFHDATMNLHCMGAVLVANKFHVVSGFADGHDLPPSYIKGYAELAGARYSSRGNSTNNQPLYLGKVNEATLDDNGIATVNGSTFEERTKGKVFYSDNYFDFTKAYKAVKADAAYLLNAPKATVDESEGWRVNVTAGTNVTISNPTKTINIVYPKDSSGKIIEPQTPTIINITAGGTVNMPQMNINGDQQQVAEQSDGTGIVWNFPNATTVNLPTMSWIGHVVAPDADVYLASGNYNGCVICKNFVTSAEGHVYPYKGGTLIPGELRLNVPKTVEGAEPKEEERGKFTFIFDELNKPGNVKQWINVAKSQNGIPATIDGKPVSTSFVDLGELIFNTTGVHWYRLYEDQTPVAGYTLDQEVFYLYVNVDVKNADGNAQYYVKEKRYYKSTIADMEDASLFTDDGLINPRSPKLTSVSVSEVGFDNKKSQAPEKAKITLGGHKTFVGLPLTDGKFEFSLIELDENKKVKTGGYSETVSCDANGNFSFSELTYTEAGVHYYKVKEKIPATVNSENAYEGIKYDTREYVVTVTVSHTENGLVASSLPKNNTIQFLNTYNTKGELTFTGTKKLVNRTLADKEFEFGLYEATVSGEDWIQGKQLRTAKNGTDGKFTFDKIAYTSAGTYYYILREIIPVDAKKEAGMTYSEKVYKIKVEATDDGKGKLSFDIHAGTGETIIYNVNTGVANVLGNDTVDTTTATFVNNFVAEDSVTFSGTKTIDGRDLKSSDVFQFEVTSAVAGAAVPMYNAAGAVQTVYTNDANGNIQFGNLKYSIADMYTNGVLETNKTFVYKVREIIPTNDDDKIPNIQYSTQTKQEFTVTVIVTYNIDTGSLNAVLDDGNTDTINFINKYNTSDETTVPAEKTLENKTLTANQFQFQVLDTSDNVLAYGKNQADGTVKFTTTENGTTEFKIVKTLEDMKTSTGYARKKSFTYKVKEVTPAEDGEIQYDRTPKYLLLIADYDPQTGVLSLHWDVNNPKAVFVNTYTAEDKVSVTGTKKLTGRKLQPGEFKFQLYEMDGTTPVATYNAGHEAFGEISNAADGTIDFGYLWYSIEDLKNTNGEITSPKTFEYVAKEVVPSDAKKAKGVTYDENAAFNVKVEVTYDEASGSLKAELAADTETIIFVNTYTNSTSIPLTGTKTLTGRKLQAGEFKFLITPATKNGAAVTATPIEKTNAEDGSIDFGTWNYTLDDITAADGTIAPSTVYTYTVREIIPADAQKKNGVTYSTESFTINVEVKYDFESGEMTAELTDDSETVAFVNTYNTSDEKTIHVWKKTFGQAATAGQFQFEILDADNHRIAIGVNAASNATDEGIVTFYKVDAEGNLPAPAAREEYKFEKNLKDDMLKDAAHPELGYESEKIFYYTVKEMIPDPKQAGDQWTYDETPHTLALVADYSEETGILTLSWMDGSQHVTFVNVYAADTSVTMSGEKHLEGRDLKAGEFTFEVDQALPLFAADGTVNGFQKGSIHMFDAYADANGNILFAPFHFTLDDMKEYADQSIAEIQPGTKKDWYCVVAEKNGGQEVDGVNYTNVKYVVKVTATYDPSAAQEVDRFTAAITGKWMQDSQGTDWNETDWAPYTESKMIFHNTYTASAKAYLTGNKTLTGIDLAAGDFTFEVYEGSSKITTYQDLENGPAAITEIKNKADGSIDFGYLTYDLSIFQKADGTLDNAYLNTETKLYERDYTYTFKEVKSFARSTTFGGTIVYAPDQTATVHVTYNKATGTMEANMSALTPVSFTNTYTASAQIGLTGTKNFIGHKLETAADSKYRFQFGLYEKAADGTIADTPVATAYNDANGNISFPDDTITKTLDNLNGKTTAEFQYVVKEIIPDDAEKDPKITYDPSVKELTLTAAYNKTTGELSLDWDEKESDEVSFTNIYNAETKCYLEGLKVLENRKLQDQEFTFYVYDPTTYALGQSYYENDKETPIPVIKNDAGGKIVFGWQHYTLSDLADGKGGYLSKKDFVYGVTEDRNGGNPNIEYSQTYYLITVTLAYDDTKKELVCGITSIDAGEFGSSQGTNNIYSKDIADITDADRAATPTIIKFVNTYKASVKEQVSGTKISPQLALKGKDYQFIIKDSDNQVYTTKTVDGTDITDIRNDANGNIDFGYFGYSLDTVVKENTDGTKVTLYDDLFASDKKTGAGEAWASEITYSYTVTENPDIKPDVTGNLQEAEYPYQPNKGFQSVSGIRMDDKEYTIQVTLKYNNATGALTEEINLLTDNAAASEISFTNEYDAKICLPILGYKNLTGRKLNPNEFTVGMYVYENGQIVGEPIKTASNGVTLPYEEAAFGHPVEKPVDELSGTMDFTLEDLKVTNADGTTSYLEEKTFHYIIQEIVPDDPKPNVEYDPIGIPVDVKVTYNKTTGKMAATYTNMTANRKIIYQNDYDVKVKVPVEGTKVLLGRELKSGEFYFAIYTNEEGAKQSLVRNTINVDEKVKFSDLEYTVKDMLPLTDAEKAAVVTDSSSDDYNGGYLSEKTFHYVVKEQFSGEEDISYDQNEYEFAVTLSFDWKTGKLTLEDVTPKPEEVPIEFVNAYKPDAQVEIEGTKELTGRDLKASEFTFELYKAKEISEGVFAVDVEADEAGKLDVKANTLNADGEGVFAFATQYYYLKDMMKDPKDIAEGYEKEKKFLYLVKEKAGDLACVTYDPAQYVVEVTVQYDAKKAPAERLKAAITKKYVKTSADASWTEISETAAIAFKNEFESETRVSKKELGQSEELAGAKIQIKDGDKVVAYWTSGEAESGHSNVEGVTVTFDTTTKEFVIKGLEVDKNYSLEETVAPDGYERITTATVFKLDDQSKVTIVSGEKEAGKSGVSAAGNTLLVEDALTVVKVSKVDATSQKELPGAHIQILDENGEVVVINGKKVEWDSTTEAKVIEGLKTNTTYTLKETVAPDGYSITVETHFMIKEDGTVVSEDTKMSEEGVLLVEDYKESKDTVIRVTKTLTLDAAGYTGEMNARNMTFYVGLYYDAARTQIVVLDGEKQIKPLKFVNASAQTVEFRGVDVNRTYYVGECTKAGVQLDTDVVGDGTTFFANFNEGYEAVVEKEDGTVTVEFENEFYDLPIGNYIEGHLTITKKLLGADGKAKKSNKTFTAGIFEDAACTVPAEDVDRNVVELNLNGGSSAEETVNVALASLDSVKTLYVAELKDGKPVGEGFEYEVSQDKTKVKITASSRDAKVTITNKEPGKPTNGVKTGDETPIIPFVILLLAAALVIFVGIYRRMRARRR